MTLLADGLVSAAKTSDVPNIHTQFGGRLAHQVFDTFPVFEKIAAPVEAERSRYLALWAGSSFSSMTNTDLSGRQLSLARRFGRRLSFALDARFRVDLQFVHQCTIGVGAGKLVSNLVVPFLHGRGVPDLIFVELADGNGSQKREYPRIALRELLALNRTCAALGCHVVAVDLLGMTRKFGQGLVSQEDHDQLFAALHKYGIHVLSSRTLLMEAALEEPWSPFGMLHLRDGAAVAAADIMTREFTEELGQLLLSAAPLVDRSAVDAKSQKAVVQLSSMQRHMLRQCDELSETVAVVDLEGDTLRVRIDFRRLAIHQQQLSENLICAGLRRAFEHPGAHTATKFAVDFIEFANHDEYGLGVLDEATRLGHHEFDGPGVRQFLDRRP
ncbi:MAG: hypothetical protein HRU17_00175 [Polyangiaceae bacterium]|nr:hypothetical protein [Polyangiaceae bacterium]